MKNTESMLDRASELLVENEDIKKFYLRLTVRIMGWRKARKMD
jgi:hypothetical protein